MAKAKKKAVKAKPLPKAKPQPKAKARPKAKPKRVKLLVATKKIAEAAQKSAARAARGAPIKRKASGVARKPAPPSDTLVLHGIFQSLPSCKVGLMLAMSDVPWAFRHVNLRDGAHRAPEFLAISKFGRVPVLQHLGQNLIESNAILEYLAAFTGKFGGRNEAERMRVREWLFWEVDRLAQGLGLPRSYARFSPQHDEVMKVARRRGEHALSELDRHLGTSKFVAGMAPTIADIAMFPWIATAEEGGFDIAAHWPNVRAWGERMLAQPGVAHPYTVLPKEDRDAVA
jgi:glutathione S-transferase